MLVNTDRIKKLIRIAETESKSVSDTEQIEALKKAVEIVEFVDKNYEEPTPVISEHKRKIDGLICVSENIFSFSSN